MPRSRSRRTAWSPAEQPHCYKWLHASNVILERPPRRSFLLRRVLGRMPLLASHAEGFHLRVLLKPCVNLSIHTASDVRLPTLKTFQWGKSVGLARRTRASHCFAPLERPRRRLNFLRAQRIR